MAENKYCWDGIERRTAWTNLTRTHRRVHDRQAIDEEYAGTALEKIPVGTMTVGFWEEINVLRPLIVDDQERAQLVKQVRHLIQQARIANRQGKLKPVSDLVRQFLWELPRVIPKKGWKNQGEFQYPDCLSMVELEKRLLDEIERFGVRRWFDVAEKAAL